MRVGYPINVDQDAINDRIKRFFLNRPITFDKTYGIQGAVISNELDYKRRDDIELSAIAYSVNKNELTTTTKDGHRKTGHERFICYRK